MGTPPATVLSMSPRRLALLALVVAALVPAAARAAVPVALYPLRVPGLAADERKDLHAFVKAGLLSGARRGVLRPRTPLLLPALCAEPFSAAACLGRLAADGVILVGRGERRGSTVVIAAALYDRNGAKTREVRFLVDLVIENLRPLQDALALLESELDEDGTVAGAPKTPPPAVARVAPKPVAPAPIAPPAPVAAAPKPSPPAPKAGASFADIPLPPPPALKTKASTPSKSATPTPTATATAAAKPAPIDVSAPAEAPVWRRQAGPFFTVVGGALVAGGAAVAIVNRSLTSDLNAKRTAGTLTAADRSSYDKVDRYNVLSTVLLAGGGVSLAAGTWIWITAPARPGDPALAVAGGRF